VSSNGPTRPKLPPASPNPFRQRWKNSPAAASKFASVIWPIPPPRPRRTPSYPLGHQIPHSSPFLPSLRSMVVLAGRPCHQIPSTTPHQLPPTSTAPSLPSRHPDLAATARRSGQISTSGRPPREDHPSAAPPRPRTHVPRRIGELRNVATCFRVFFGGIFAGCFV
jgi:hypothetical protein